MGINKITDKWYDIFRRYFFYRSARGAAALRLYSHFPSLIFN